LHFSFLIFRCCCIWTLRRSDIRFNSNPFAGWIVRRHTMWSIAITFLLPLCGLATAGTSDISQNLLSSAFDKKIMRKSRERPNSAKFDPDITLDTVSKHTFSTLWLYKFWTILHLRSSHHHDLETFIWLVYWLNRNLRLKMILSVQSRSHHLQLSLRCLFSCLIAFSKLLEILPSIWCNFSKLWLCRRFQLDRLIKAAFRYSLRVLNIYSARHVCYRFWALAVNIGTHPKCQPWFWSTTNAIG